MRTLTLGKLGPIVTGKTPKTAVETNFGGPFPFVTPTDMGEGRHIYSTLRTLSDAGLSSVSKAPIPAGSVMVSCIGSDMGKTFIAGVDCFTNQQINSITVDTQKTNPIFVYYNLFSRRAELQRLAAGSSAQPILNKSNFSNIEIELPVRAEQDAIAETLGALDDKIEVNRRMNETLEAMARAAFRDWFVDFGPTRRQMAGASDPHAILGGLIQNQEEAHRLAALFPAALGDNGLPEGWEEGTLSDYAALNPKSWTAKKHPETLEYVDLANTKWGTIETTIRFDWDDAPSRARRIIEPGDTIVGTVRPGNGSYAYIGDEGLTASTGFAVLRPKTKALSPFVNCAATSEENIETLASLADGGAYPAVRPDVVLATPAPLVADELVGGFGLITQTLLDKVEANKRENRTLAATRDLLLPKLMSGEIRLMDAEALG